MREANISVCCCYYYAGTKSPKGANDAWGQMSKFKVRSLGRWNSLLPGHLAPVRRDLHLLDQGISALAAPKNQRKEL